MQKLIVQPRFPHVVLHVSWLECPMFQFASALKLHLGVHKICLHDEVSAMDYPRRKTHLNVDISGICVKLNTLRKLSFGYTA